MSTLSLNSSECFDDSLGKPVFWGWCPNSDNGRCPVRPSSRSECESRYNRTHAGDDRYNERRSGGLPPGRRTRGTVFLDSRKHLRVDGRVVFLIIFLKVCLGSSNSHFSGVRVIVRTLGSAKLGRGKVLVIVSRRLVTTLIMYVG